MVPFPMTLCNSFISDIAIFVLKRDVKLQLTTGNCVTPNDPIPLLFSTICSAFPITGGDIQTTHKYAG